jgi:VanZ family protein
MVGQSPPKVKDPVSAPAPSGSPWRRRVGWSLGTILLVAVVVSFAPAPGANRLNAAAHDLAHVLVFAVVGHLLMNLVVLRWRIGAAALLSLVAGGALGLTTEAAQSLTGGDPSVGDLLRDLLGTALGVLAALALRAPATAAHVGSSSPRLRRAAWAAIALGSAAALLPFAFVALQYRHRTALLPVLLAAPDATSRRFARLLPDRELPAAGSPTITVPLDRGRWPGLSLDEPFPDWRGQRALALDVANPGAQALALNLRVHDSRHDGRHEDRFNQAIVLSPGERRVLKVPVTAIAAGPRDRALRLESIDAVILFHDGPLPGGRFELARIWLEP